MCRPQRWHRQRMQRMAEEGKICRIIVKDLSRFGREQVEAGKLVFRFGILS